MNEYETTIWIAREIVTMGFDKPLATALAVREGRVVAVGDLAHCRDAAGHGTVVDDRYADSVIVPGMVEAHAHAAEGAVGTKVDWVARFDRRLADGTIAPGVTSYEALVDRVQSVADRMDASGVDGGEPVVVGGFDPIYFTGARLNRHHLDAVATMRPVVVQHVSGHLTTVSTRALERWDITDDLGVDGIGRGSDGRPDGELRENAQSLLRGVKTTVQMASEPDVIRWWGEAAARSGITTCADLASLAFIREPLQQTWSAVTREPTFPIRAVSYPVPQFVNEPVDEIVKVVQDFRAAFAHDRWRISGVKIVLDGSIQGFTATLSWPGYHTGEGHPMFLLPIERMQELLVGFHRAGINVHVHCNGDLAAEAVLKAVEVALQTHAWLDHRHTITHAQTMTSAQLRRAHTLRMGVNFFANHLWYWGDQHHDITLGPDRAARIDPCGEAAAIGLPFAIHSDAPVTPIGQLHTMWCAVNRRTPSGRVLGENQRVSAAQALRAVTLDAAWMLHLDFEIGSLEVAKRADFAVLDTNPLTCDPDAIRDIGVVATALDGVPVG